MGRIADLLAPGGLVAMILESAVVARVGVLYTEDLQRGQIIRGVRITNPFAHSRSGL